MINKPLKIGIFSDSYHPYVSGVFHRDLLPNWPGWDTKSIFAPAPQVKGQQEENIFRFPLPYPFNSELYIALPLTWTARKYVSDIGLDVIHTHSPLPWAGREKDTGAI